MNVEPRTASVTVTMQPWQKARLDSVAEAVGTSAERAARLLVLGGLLTPEPVAQLAIALERIGRYAMRSTARAEEARPAAKEDASLYIIVNAGTARVLQELAAESTAGDVGRVVELLARRVDPQALRPEVQPDRFCGRLVTA